MRPLAAAVCLSLVVACCSLFAVDEESSVAVTSPPQNPPQILVAAAIAADDHLILVRYQTIYIGFEGESYNSRSLTRVSLKDVRIRNVAGEELSLKSVRERMAGGDTPILVSSWKEPLPDFYQSMFTPKTLHFVFPKQAPDWHPIQDPGRPVR